MTFTSYAQNFEDVILYRALKSIRSGFYIDVGAWHPVDESVTKAFYDLGWCGINIEPVASQFALIREARPRDVNLRKVVSDVAEPVLFYECLATGLSTAGKTVMKCLQDKGHKFVCTEVNGDTLDNIIEQHNVEVVHFLKIDVEGFEAEVLKGISLERVRPWIIVVEATEPLTPKPTWAEWEHLLTDRSYSFVYFDGLNRFYVSAEKGELKDSFGVPPNVFDDFKLRAVVEAEAKVVEALSVYSSRSWRVTAPLRKLRTLLQRLRRKRDKDREICSI